MSRALSVTLTSYLAGPMIALANCVKIERLDGVIYGFTSLDRDLVIDGITYLADSSVDASDVTQQEGSGVDNLSIVSLLRSSVITEVDLEAGLWDGAAVTLFQVNFEDLTMGKIVLLSGFIGNLEADGAQYTAEVRSLSQRLAQQIVELTSNLCRVRRLFDERCMPKGYNENGVADNTLQPDDFRFTATIAQVGTDGNGFFFIDFQGPTTPVGGNLKASSYYAGGLVRALSGLNQGIEREVKSHTIQIITGPLTVARIILQEPYPWTHSVGDSYLLEAGCDRRASTCRNVFANIYNIQAEIHLPGSEAILTRGRK